MAKKKKIAAPAKPLLDKREWNFQYLEKLPALKRAAVLYEYARHNSELLRWITTLREKNIFSGQPIDESEPGMQHIVQKMVSEMGYLTIHELFFLTTCGVFPQWPFEYALGEINDALASSLRGGVISGPAAHLSTVAPLWYDYFRRHNLLEPLWNRGQSVQTFMIPWETNTDDQLASMFKAWLKSNRPLSFPEKANGGRGKGLDGGAGDHLRQLAMWRLSKHGNTWQQAKSAGLEGCSSAKSWSRAIRDAEARIIELYQPDDWD